MQKIAYQIRFEFFRDQKGRMRFRHALKNDTATDTRKFFIGNQIMFFVSKSVGFVCCELRIILKSLCNFKLTDQFYRS